MPNTTQNIISEILVYLLAWVSTLFVTDWVLEVVSATCVLLIAKITDHYLRSKIIAKIDLFRVKWRLFKETHKKGN